MADLMSGDAPEVRLIARGNATARIPMLRTVEAYAIRVTGEGVSMGLGQYIRVAVNVGDGYGQGPAEGAIEFEREQLRHPRFPRQDGLAKGLLVEGRH